MNILSGEYTSITRFEASDGELIVFQSDLFIKTGTDDTSRENPEDRKFNYEHPHMLTHTSVYAPSITGSGFEWTYDSTFAFSLNHLDINRMFLNLYQNMDKPIADQILMDNPWK